MLWYSMRRFVDAERSVTWTADATFAGSKKESARNHQDGQLTRVGSIPESLDAQLYRQLQAVQQSTDRVTPGRLVCLTIPTSLTLYALLSTR
jgi:hypothetical protein